jgi:hypothetical protein
MRRVSGEVIQGGGSAGFAAALQGHFVTINSLKSKERSWNVYENKGAMW